MPTSLYLQAIAQTLGNDAGQLGEPLVVQRGWLPGCSEMRLEDSLKALHATIPFVNSAEDIGIVGFYPCVGKIPCGREGQPLEIFLPGKSHGQRSLVGYSPCGCRVEHE